MSTHIHVEQRRAVVNGECRVVIHIVAKLQVGHPAPEVGAEGLESGTESRGISILEICIRRSG